MKKFILALAMVSAVAACETTEQNMAAGAATGAILGATFGNDRNSDRENAAIGAVVGTIAGIAVGAAQEGKTCTYRYSDGTTATGPCPEGY